MKKTLLFLPAILLAFGCHNYQADADKLQLEKEQMAQEVAYKDSSILSFISQFNEIENNLAMIDKAQVALSDNSMNGELKVKQIDRINKNIKSINELVETNKAKIASLTKQLKNSHFKAAEFEKMIASLNVQIQEKDKQLVELNEKLATLNTTVDKLNTDVATLTADGTAKEKVIEDQTSKLNTAYFTTGTYKELESKNVVNKTGGFLGLGKEKTVEKDFEQSAFSTIDITKTSTIPIDAKDAEVLTNHPSDSYTLQHSGNNVSNLQITDPEKFWRASKYLVVVVNK